MITYVLLGSLMGIVSGILPGVSVSTALLILTPWLLDWSAQAIVFFYIAAMITSQFTGSVSAILFGVPGEVSSLPTVQEHARIQQFGLTNTLIAGTAICSVLGGGLAMLITYLSLLGINFFYGYFNHLIQSMIMLLVIGLLAVTGNNKWFVNVALIVFGAFLSFIGFNYILNTNFLTFGNAYLEQGLPPITLMICLFAIPVIVNAFAERVHKQTNQDKAPIKWPLIYRALPTMLRSSGLGWLLGLIPGMSYAYSSTASYSTEHWFEKNKTSEQAIANRVVAAETANNAGVISCLIPFLIFGIPIISSEIIVINLLDQNTVLNFAWVLNNINAILLTMAVASVIGLLSAWPMSRIVVKLIDFDNRWLQMLLLLLLAITVIYVGYDRNQVWYYVLVALVLLPIGLALKKYDTLPLILTALFFDNIVSVLYRTWLIYS